MTDRITIFGYGPVGRATAARLVAEGREVIVAQRNAQAISQRERRSRPSTRSTATRSSRSCAARGSSWSQSAFPIRRLWRDVWPTVISNFVAACKATGARMVFIDNLYMYGPQTTPLIETMPLSYRGLKPAARSAATRSGWPQRPPAKRVWRLFAPDFYGPGVGLSFLGDTSIGKLAQGKPAVFVGSPDVLHDYAYVPDVARAATTLLDAPDSAFGQAWHMPCAPTRTTRDILQIAADTLGVKLRISAMPAWMLGPSAMFSPLLRELKEMRFQWDRPYQVDASRFKAAFWSDVTPFETGVAETALAFRAELKRKR